MAVRPTSRSVLIFMRGRALILMEVVRVHRGTAASFPPRYTCLIFAQISAARAPAASVVLTRAGHERV